MLIGNEKIVWVDEIESFYCHLEECSFEQGNRSLDPHGKYLVAESKGISRIWL